MIGTKPAYSFIHSFSRLAWSRWISNTIACLLFVSAISPLAIADEAEDSRIQELEKRIEALEAELARVRAELVDIRSHPVPKSEPNILAAEQTSSLQTSGFLHVFGDPLHLDARPFTLGSFEYDVTAAISDNVSTSGALVFTQDQTALGIGFVDVHFGGKGVGPRGRIFGEPGAHLQVGRFDIPFGLDYRFFAAPDRVNIKAPLITQTLFNGGLNREGIRVYASGRHVQYTVFGTRSLAEDLGFSMGGRIGFSPTRNVYTLHRKTRGELTIGVSWVLNYGHDWIWIGRFFGTDAEYSAGPLVLTGEWASRADFAIRREAFYISSVIYVGRPFGFPTHLFFRYDRGDSMQKLLSAGANVRFGEKAVLKTEAGHYWSFGRIDAEAADLHRDNVNVQLVLLF